jgi:hypothetical protein
MARTSQIPRIRLVHGVPDYCTLHLCGDYLSRLFKV